MMVVCGEGIEVKLCNDECVGLCARMSLITFMFRVCSQAKVMYVCCERFSTFLCVCVFVHTEL